VLAPDPPNRLHNQHPPATHSRSPSEQPVQLIADGVKVGRRSPLYGGESSTPKHSLGRDGEGTRDYRHLTNTVPESSGRAASSFTP
jgi:hypothetical protein